MGNQVVNYDGSIIASPQAACLPANGRRDSDDLARYRQLSEPRPCHGELSFSNSMRVVGWHHCELVKNGSGCRD